MANTSFDKVLIFNADRCTGCRVCEMACSMAKQGEYNPKRSYIKILKNQEMDVNIAALDLQCDGCNDCVAWCISEALRFVSPGEAAIIRKENRLGIFPAPMLRSA